VITIRTRERKGNKGKQGFITKSGIGVVTEKGKMNRGVLGVLDRDVEVLRVDTDDNPADMFTKPLGRVKFELFRSMLGLKFHSS